MGLRSWTMGHRVGVEDLTLGGTGVPVRKSSSTRSKTTAYEFVTNYVDRKQGVGRGPSQRLMTHPSRSGW
jgi:hypothetical protein